MGRLRQAPVRTSGPTATKAKSNEDQTLENEQLQDQTLESPGCAATWPEPESAGTDGAHMKAMIPKGSSSSASMELGPKSHTGF